MHLLWSVSLLLIIGTTLAADESAMPEDHETEVHAREAWIQMDKDLKSAMNKIVRKVLPALMKEVYKKEISTSCMTALLHFTNNLKQSKTWAYKMLDSSGRFPEGFLSGTLTSLGNYQECVSIRVNTTKFKMQGQYCSIEVIPPLPEWKPFTTMHGTVPEMKNISAPDSVISHILTIIHNLHVTSIKIGVCTPSQCSQEDINKLVQIIPEKLGIDWKMGAKRCEVREELQFTHPQVIVLYVIGTVLFLVLVGTAFDCCCFSDKMEKNTIKYKLYQLVCAFSFFANARKLSEFSCPQDQLSFVYGLMFIVFYWTNVSNTFMYVNYDVISNILKAFEIVQELFYEIALNRVISLQVLFFISGLVTTYRWLTSVDKGFKIWKFLLRRYLRYTPAYALILALLLVAPTWGSGPTWSSAMEPIYNNCKSNWWYNLLYINNYIDSDKMCLEHTWVFAVDAQLHILALFVLIPLKMRPKIGLMVNFMLLLASLVSVALTNVYYDLPPNEVLAFLHVKDRQFYAEHSYYRLYTHIPLYCIGVFVAYFMVQYPAIKISLKMRIFWWMTSLTSVLAACSSVHEWRSGHVPTPLVAAIYSALSKIALGAFLSWLSIACMSGNANGLRDALSWRPFAFLGKLFFIAYLMHVPVILMVQGFSKTHLFIGDLQLVYITLNHAAGTLIVSYLLYMCFEGPFISLMGVVTHRHKGRSLSSTSDMRPMTEKPTNKDIPTWRASDKSNC